MLQLLRSSTHDANYTPMKNSLHEWLWMHINHNFNKKKTDFCQPSFTYYTKTKDNKGMCTFCKYLITIKLPTNWLS